MTRVLIVDDSPTEVHYLRSALERNGFETEAAATGQEGVALVQKESPDLVFLDIKMPGTDGIEVLKQLRAVDETLPIVMISGHGNIESAVRAIKMGAFDFVEKPLSLEKTVLVVRNALRQRPVRIAPDTPDLDVEAGKPSRDHAPHAA